MKKKKLLSTILLSMCCIFATTSCQDDKLLNDSAQEPSLAVSPQTRAVTPYEFNWENADWMPTPAGQSKIPVPWIGQGSLASFYGLDVINDRKKSDGWELLYSTFDPNSSGEIKYPYFILYNKYRGLMRIFYYTTGDIIAASTYLQDELTINSSNNTSLLNFLGEEIVDASQYKMQYQQIQPTPLDGSMPVAGRRWYMMQYELAYDPNLTQISHNDIQLIWHLNYYNVDSISLGGTIEGKINGTIGAASNNNPFSGVTNLGKVVGKGALAAVGMSVLENNSTDTESGENTLGLPKKIFKAAYKGAKSAVSSATGDIPGAIIGLLSGILGGSTGPTPISLNIDAQISMSGTSVQSGSFPSTSISFWIPGTIIPSDANGYIPLHRESLGIINFVGKPDITIPVESILHEEPDEPFDPDRMLEIEESYAYPPRSIDYSSHLIINPEVHKIAKVEILRQDIAAMHEDGEIEINPGSYYACSGAGSYSHGYTDVDFPKLKFGVRFTIKVTPLDGNPSSIIYKTFLLNDKWININ